MSKFHSIKIADIYKETKDCSVISFEIPVDLKKEDAIKTIRQYENEKNMPKT